MGGTSEPAFLRSSQVTLVIPVCGPHFEQHWPRPSLLGTGAMSSSSRMYSSKRPIAFAFLESKELNNWLLILPERSRGFSLPQTIKNILFLPRSLPQHSHRGADGRLPGAGAGSCYSQNLSSFQGPHRLVSFCGGAGMPGFRNGTTSTYSPAELKT